MKPYSLTLAGLLAGSLLGTSCLAQTVSGPTLLDPGAGLSQPDSADPLYVPNRFELVYAEDAPGAGQRREALVDVLVTVDAAGKVGRVKVLDGFHDPGVRRLVENAVKQASFNPATAGGEPVAFENLELQVLQRGAYPPGITADMREDLAKLADELAEKDFRGAERRIDSLLGRKAMRLFELALLNDQLVSVYMETERVPEALLASRVATGRSPAVQPSAEEQAASPDAVYPDSFLPPDLYVDALRKRVVLSLMNNQIGEARQSFAELQQAAAQAGKDVVVTELQPQMDKVETLLASEEPVGSAIRLIDEEWSYTMSSRRTFGVTGLDGRV
ncbi:MAG TPA: energy transducer TonB, partial [Hyphomicrobiales bacterium]|nr:energy transducer TonB [Hyphomicrobiales bacterium]